MFELTILVDSGKFLNDIQVFILCKMQQNIESFSSLYSPPSKFGTFPLMLPLDTTLNSNIDVALMLL